MLNYLIDTIGRLAIVSALIGMMAAYVQVYFYGKTKRYLQVGGLVGTVLAAIMMYFKTFTTRVDTSLWNLREFVTAVILAILFIVLHLLSNKIKEKAMPLISIVLGLNIAVMLLYYATAIFEMPYTSYVSNSNVLSTNYLLSVVGLILGLLLNVVLAVSVYKGLIAIGKPHTFSILLIGLLINSAKFIGLSCGILLTKRYVMNNHTLFVISKFANNHINVFLYLTLILCAIVQLIILVRSFTQNETYTNPAERRKIISKWRKRKRWALTTLVCAILMTLNLTVVYAYNNQEVELSPVESSVEENGNMYIPFEQVSDGKLHRFAHTTDDGVQIRVIVIQKPNSSSFGIGLDACDICGETGYYEKDGQVICNRCDVVMNVNTIGFKGGCNPIVIDYSLENNKIVIPIEGLELHADEFSK